MIDTPEMQYQHLVDEALEVLPADLVQRLRILLDRASGHAFTAWENFTEEMTKDDDDWRRFDAWLAASAKNPVPYEYRRRPS